VRKSRSIYKIDVDPELIPTPPPYSIEPLRQSIFAQERVAVARMRHDAIVQAEQDEQDQKNM
jgi:hypothetical protein